MPLTSPNYTDQSSRCTVSVRSIDRDVRISVTLNPEQVEAWSDQDLTDRVDNLMGAIRAFLVPGESLRLDVAWAGSAQQQLMTSDEVVAAEAPAVPAVGEPTP